MVLTLENILSSSYVPQFHFLTLLDRINKFIPIYVYNVQLVFKVYADMENGECNALDFQLGTSGIEAQLEGNRGWNIKV